MDYEQGLQRDINLDLQIFLSQLRAFCDLKLSSSYMWEQERRIIHTSDTPLISIYFFTINDHALFTLFII